MKAAISRRVRIITRAACLLGSSPPSLSPVNIQLSSTYVQTERSARTARARIDDGERCAERLSTERTDRTDASKGAIMLATSASFAVARAASRLAASMASGVAIGGGARAVSSHSENTNTYVQEALRELTLPSSQEELVSRHHPIPARAFGIAPIVSRAPNLPTDPARAHARP